MNKESSAVVYYVCLPQNVLWKVAKISTKLEHVGIYGERRRCYDECLRKDTNVGRRCRIEHEAASSAW